MLEKIFNRKNYVDRKEKDWQNFMKNLFLKI